MNNALWQQLLHRPPSVNKYDLGHVLVVGGSVEMVGAPVLVARAALRIGAGLATVASTANTTQLIDRDIEEVMTLTLPNWSKADECLALLGRFIKDRHVTAVVVGPGLSANASAVVWGVLKSLQVPVVVDAFSFTALSGHMDTLKMAAEKNKNLVLTPHPGEFLRLSPDASLNAQSERSEVIKFAKRYGVTLVMKHNHTLVASQTGEIYQNATGNSGLATAGAGDVLAGIIAGTLAQKITPYEAAKMAVYIHGLAADIASKTRTEPGLIASDVIEALPAALHDIDRRGR